MLLAIVEPFTAPSLSRMRLVWGVPMNPMGLLGTLEAYLKTISRPVKGSAIGASDPGI